MENQLDFTPIDTINTLFPNEQSFSNADSVLEKISKKDLKIEESIQRLMDLSSNSCNHLEDLNISKNAISYLVSAIEDIKIKSTHAEKTVQDITKEIKTLDCAKRNITFSILLLNRLSMLSSAVEQLNAVVQTKHYKDVASLLKACDELSSHFTLYRGVKCINILFESINNTRVELKRLTFSEFESSYKSTGEFVGNSCILAEACCVINVLTEDCKKHLLDWYCDLQLREYVSIFRNSQEVGNLQNISRRYAWLKRLIKSFGMRDFYIR
jgi:hypothetical protein